MSQSQRLSQRFLFNAFSWFGFTRHVSSCVRSTKLLSPSRNRSARSSCIARSSGRRTVFHLNLQPTKTSASTISFICFIALRTFVSPFVKYQPWSAQSNSISILPFFPTRRGRSCCCLNTPPISFRLKVRRIFAVPLDPVRQKPSTVFGVTVGPPHIVKVTESKRALYVFGSNDGSLLAARSATPRSKFESKSKVNPEISSQPFFSNSFFVTC